MPQSSLYQNPHTVLRRRRWSHRLALLLCAATLVLLAAGALVTGTGSGLAVPDWPLAYGQLFPPMVGGILYEHGHRLVAASVGLVTVVLGGWLWFAEERLWVKVLGLSAIGVVVLQGLLGGVTVLYLLPKAISIGHALLAQLFFLLTVGLVQVTAPGWDRMRGRRGGQGRARFWGRSALGALLVALFLGATMRHNAAGLAIPDFPLAFGSLIPPLTSFPVTIHYLHRLGALVALLLVAATIWETVRRHRAEPALFRVAVAMGLLLALQISLGGWAIWSRLAVPVTTLHLVNGALLLGTAGLFALRAEILETPLDKSA